MPALKISQLQVSRGASSDRRCPELRDFVTKLREGILARLTRRDGAGSGGAGQS